MICMARMRRKGRQEAKKDSEQLPKREIHFTFKVLTLNKKTLSLSTFTCIATLLLSSMNIHKTTKKNKNNISLLLL